MRVDFVVLGLEMLSLFILLSWIGFSFLIYRIYAHKYIMLTLSLLLMMQGMNFYYSMLFNNSLLFAVVKCCLTMFLLLWEWSRYWMYGWGPYEAG